jgi:hypothetical protein
VANVSVCIQLNILSLHITKAVVNLSNTPMDDATHSALAKGLNFTVSPLVLPSEDNIGNIEKAIIILPVESAYKV